MLEHVDAQFVANEISLLRDTFRQAVIIVEGPDDGRLLTKFAATADLCRIVPAHGKDNALQALKLLKERGRGQLTLVLVDADFWHLTGEVPDDPDIVVTDHHDIEVDMLMSDALDALLRELCDPAALTQFEARCGVSIRDHILKEAARVGRIRYANYGGQLFLKFREVDLGEYVDPESIVIDLDAYIAQVVEGSSADLGMVVAEAESMTSSLDHLSQFVRGHDFIAVLSVALRKSIATCSVDIAEPTHVQKMLRLAFAREHLERLQFYAAMAEWEDRNGASVLS